MNGCDSVMQIKNTKPSRATLCGLYKLWKPPRVEQKGKKI
ncbi:MAG: hypothetical protein Rpha_1618 [Candidatus Ruthia sp. Apha_13_S6]|nr:hypothetical protein [Candidatus Ruthia sp. Apha_13_S6]